uniref:Putative secreted protein n=1 Tax=Ixodes ricinus TaxID=34613 RepID=A0A6B0UXJ6_IXORI
MMAVSPWDRCWSLGLFLKKTLHLLWGLVPTMMTCAVATASRSSVVTMQVYVPARPECILRIQSVVADTMYRLGSGMLPFSTAVSSFFQVTLAPGTFGRHLRIRLSSEGTVSSPEISSMSSLEGTRLCLGMVTVWASSTSASSSPVTRLKEAIKPLNSEKLSL